MRLLRRLLIGIVGIIAVLALVLHLPWVQRRVFEQAQAWLVSRQIAVSASRLHYDLFSGSISLDDLEVRAIGASDPTPLLTARQASVNLAMLQLITGTPVIETARLSGVSVAYRVHENGGNWPVAAESEPAAPDEPRSLTRRSGSAI
jgi:hypothetical protein